MSYCLLNAQILQEGAIKGQINSWEDRKSSIREGLLIQKIKKFRVAGGPKEIAGQGQRLGGPGVS